MIIIIINLILINIIIIINIRIILQGPILARNMENLIDTFSSMNIDKMSYRKNKMNSKQWNDNNGVNLKKEMKQLNKQIAILESKLVSARSNLFKFRHEYIRK